LTPKAISTTILVLTCGLLIDHHGKSVYAFKHLIPLGKHWQTQ